MSRFLKDGYKFLKPYVPGEQPQDTQYIKLNTNESPFPPSPKVMECLNEKEAENLRLYSDPESDILVNSIVNYYGVDKENVMVTNGSDEALAFIFCGFFDKNREVCFPDITYGFYPVFCQFADLKINEIPLKEDFTLDIEAFENSEKNVVIANPNAPTGIAVTVDDIRKITAKNKDRLVVVDEAYVDFGTYSCVSLIKEFDNLIVVQTFSKSRSLAGARLGVVFACPTLISDLKAVKYSFNPYNVNRLTERIGAAAVNDAFYFDNCRAAIMKNRAFTARELKKIGFEVLPSNANFLFARHEKIGGEELYKNLKKRGILVRHFDKDRIRDFIRITIGTENDMKEFLKAVEEIAEGLNEKSGD